MKQKPHIIYRSHTNLVMVFSVIDKYNDVLFSMEYGVENKRYVAKRVFFVGGYAESDPDLLFVDLNILTEICVHIQQNKQEILLDLSTKHIGRI